MTHEEQLETAESLKKLTARVTDLEREHGILRTHVVALAETRPPSTPPATTTPSTSPPG